MADDHARGRQFEDAVRRLFEHSRFDVVRNPGAAHPRQTDLYARYGDEKYLVEVKWRKAKANVDDFESFCSRLQKVLPDVAGIFFSTAGFTPEVVQQLEEHRTRQVLLFDGEEIRALFNSPRTLRAVIRRKRDYCGVHGRVLLGTEAVRAAAEPKPDRKLLPDADGRLWSPQDRYRPWVKGAGAFGAMVCAQELVDIDSGVGNGIAFDLPLHIASRSDFAHVLEVLRRHVGVSGAGRYSLQQSEVCWQGAGAAGFLRALDTWRSRYRELGDRRHHSEEVAYFDVCEGGFYTLTGQVHVAPGGGVSYPEFSARLMGIPVDPTPFRELARAFDLADQAYFRPLAKDVVQRFRPWSDAAPRLEVVRFLRSGQWITGVVAKNPFYGRLATRSASIERDTMPDALGSFEFLLCRVGSHHLVGHDVDYYYLRDVWFAETDGACVLWAFADWEDRDENGAERPPRQDVVANLPLDLDRLGLDGSEHEGGWGTSG